MQRRFALPLFAAICLATLTGMGVAQQTGAPGTITTVAGTGEANDSPDGGPATQADLNGPEGLAVDAAGNLFIGDSFNDRVRKVSPSGIISTVAARLTHPGFIALDQAGNLFIKEDSYGDANRVRKLSPAGLLTTVAGTGTPGFSGDGGPATEARLYGPGGLAVDAAGNLFIADHYNSRIRKVSPDGIITTVAGSDAPGFSGDGGSATQARLNQPTGVAVDTAGNLFIADGGNHRIRKVDTNGIISTVAGNGTDRYAGDGAPATATGLGWPRGLAVDAVGNLLIAEAGGHRVLKVFGVAAPGLIAGEPFPSP